MFQRTNRGGELLELVTGHEELGQLAEMAQRLREEDESGQMNQSMLANYQCLKYDCHHKSRVTNLLKPKSNVVQSAWEATSGGSSTKLQPERSNTVEFSLRACCTLVFISPDKAPTLALQKFAKSHRSQPVISTTNEIILFC
jgi:hypothetical protein